MGCERKKTDCEWRIFGCERKKMDYEGNIYGMKQGLLTAKEGKRCIRKKLLANLKLNHV